MSSCVRTRSTSVVLLGDGVLDLDARVHLDEDVPVARPVSTRNSTVPALT